MIGKRMAFYELPVLAESVKTFDNRIYKLIGMYGIEQKTGEREHVADIYYRARTVECGNEIIAKRKKECDELKKVSSKRQIN